MTRILAATLAATLALSGAAMASPDAQVPQDTQAAIRTLLEAQGYEVRQIETEDGMFEAYALKDGERYEIYINADMQIVRTQRDD
ncbi:MAG: PepSY domain-containing protein [Roseicyclus sp.]|uniref:PepSY domain-containing protein n=1 Tax=Roseicyclus sp. TaxID=1914329 RepID=UPI003A84C963